MRLAFVQLLLSYIVRVLGQLSTTEDSNTNYVYFFDFGSKTTICPMNATCMDGQFNFLCAKNPTRPSKACKRFVPIAYTPLSRAKMVFIHNGVRNNLASKLGLSNMNLVYWNFKLQHMAEQYLELCRPHPDTCRIVGYNAYEVGMNSVFVNRRNIDVQMEWEGRTVGNWFSELAGKFDIDDVTRQESAGKLKNFTQLIWPPLEYIGCSAAIMFNGFFVVCYYYPAISAHLKTAITYLKRGETCVCPRERSVCSQLFTSLCGVDLESGGVACAVNLLLLVFILPIGAIV